MSATIRERIHAKLAEVLADGLALAYPDGIRVERNRGAAFQRFPAINIMNGPDAPLDPPSTGERLRVASPVIEGFVQTERDDHAGPELEQLYGQVLKVLLEDPRLGDLAIDSRDREYTPDMSRLAGQNPVSSFELVIDIQYCTTETDPYSQGPGV